MFLFFFLNKKTVGKVTPLTEAASLNEALRQFSPRLHKGATQNYYLRRPSQCASNFENKKSSCVIRNTRTSQKPFSALVFLRFFTKIFYSLGFLLEFFMIYIESLLPTVDFLCIDFFIRAFDNKFFQKGIYRAFKMLEKAFFLFLSE